ncbi:(2,3-dihydroxybenzoyl)adenylate synthase [Bacillus cereus]|uniref:(2,3-dihydroxybenzoyl)adenylate synthase n=2 Tax=Bacillus cereus group TaxID=86661 RepID=A0AAW9JFZ9_BACTU|nr:MULTISPECIES: (2,3-dihydroxybenzoyl)adenylate synthase [Bacillus cereus group]MDN4872986.1 (2,3-dihydroxybenzoyl)adenylate synthase [Bacillus cereus]MDZ5475637.1 (2,3-dihydroxybenzoyl)adenylate synthase [Bacillus thuringiensis]MRB33248.1 (2,3-dihydroxybenzoyl)adenylate synthase [Bacillus thuringiensis]WHT91498.1 (2,3-dihydroxybenzoyl)adenylate synthase [Bacillus cereus]
MLDGVVEWPEELVDLYIKNKCWSGQTFGEMLKERANRYGDKIAITEGDKRITYNQLDRRATQLAAGFEKLGINKNDRIILQIPNISEFIEVSFALFRIGAIPVFTLPKHRFNEINYFCEHTEAKGYIIKDKELEFDYRNLARDIREVNKTLEFVIVIGDEEEFISLEDLYINESNLKFKQKIDAGETAFLQISGGTTGLPKLIPRTHNEYIYSLKLSADISNLDQESVYLAVLPIAHNYPLSSPGILGTLYAGGRIVLASNGSPDVAFPLIEKEKVTITALVPPLAIIWLNAREHYKNDLTSLQVIQVGGAKFSQEVAKRIRPIFGCTLQQVFGMAEGLVNYTRLEDPEDIITKTQGKPMSKYDEIKIVDNFDNEVNRGEVGNLLTRGPYTIRGYYKAEEHNFKSFTTEGYYRTGDLVKLTEDGYLIVEGRVKDQINRGGEKISAEEVENHLLAHKDITDVAIVSIPDLYLGERIGAYIIPKVNRPTLKDLKEFLTLRGVAEYKFPDQLEYITEFPETGVGKVSKKELRKMISDKYRKTKLNY